MACKCGGCWACLLAQGRDEDLFPCDCPDCGQRVCRCPEPHGPDGDCRPPSDPAIPHPASEDDECQCPDCRYMS
jgi:hypothetical protein